tara:strand:- start:197 stop:805 length:609 start_codon:yes stop_codon:yes gene_type:complete
MKIRFFVILAVLILMGTTYAFETAQDDVILLTLHYNKGEISADYVLKTSGYFHEEKLQSGDDYALKIVDSSGDLLHSQRFDFQLELFLSPLPEWFDEEGNQIYIPIQSETKRLLDEATVEFMLPYFKNAERILIYGTKKEVVLEIELPEFKNEQAYLRPYGYGYEPEYTEAYGYGDKESSGSPSFFDRIFRSITGYLIKISS